MALRLIDAPASPRPSAHEAVPAARLVPAAAARLAAGDWAGYRAVVAEAGEVADPHRRYEARRALLELGLSEGSTVATLVATAAAAVDMLQADPREPVLLNYAGVIFYELGAVKAATALFSAAQRLDPELPNVEGNLAECTRRKRKGVRVVPQAAGPVRDLQPRVDRIAAAARPAEGLTLSLCMIVKDEEAMIGRCLEAARNAVDEIVVVDTGSTDRTVEIAERHGARILHHAWDGDFAAARNASFDAATGDWVMYLDADEVLVADDAQRLRALTGRTWREAFFLTETNHTGDIEDGTAITHDAMRVFRNRPEYRFEGRIHEQIAQHLPGYLPERQERTTVRVEHFGYLGAVRNTKDKTNRNLELLERQVAEGVDNPFLHFNLGSEYAAAGDAPRALTHFQRAWAAVREEGRVTSDGYAPALAARYVHALRNTGRMADVAAAGDEALEIFPGFTDIVLEQALAAGATGDLEREEALLRRCLEMGDGPSRYSATVGCGTFRALVALADALRRRGALEEAEATLRGCLQEHPGFLAAVDPYAAALLRRGVPAPEVVGTVHALVADSTPSMRFLLAVALSEAGAVAEAESELRAVLDGPAGQRPRQRRPGRDPSGPGRLRRRRGDRRSGRPRGAVCGRRPAHRALRAPGRRHAGRRPARAGPARRGACRLRRLAGRALGRHRAGRAAERGRGPDPHHARRARAPAGLRCLRGPRGRARGRRDPVAPASRGARRAVPAPRLRTTPPPRSGSRSASATASTSPRCAGMAAVAIARGLDEDAQVFVAEAEALAAA